MSRRGSGGGQDWVRRGSGGGQEPPAPRLNFAASRPGIVLGAGPMFRNCHTLRATNRKPDTENIPYVRPIGSQALRMFPTCDQ
jgi:hypothetical protein